MALYLSPTQATFQLMTSGELLVMVKGEEGSMVIHLSIEQKLALLKVLQEEKKEEEK